ncbi:MAG: porin family protein [Alphaproteobacteria bacterium]|nr:porin family protein [Alphaproteobacteria bacterium]
MYFKQFPLSCLALGASIGMAMAADSDTPAVVTPAQMPFYLSLHGGVTFPDNPDIVFDLLGQTGVPGRGNNDNGYRVGGALGYGFNELLSGEVEVSYANSDVNSIYAGGIFNVTTPTTGDGSLWTTMGNIVLGHDMGGWRPYVGAGAGAARMDLDVSGFGSGVDDHDWTWAVQAFAGADLSLTQNMSIGARYRYQHVGSTNFSDGNGLPIGLDETGVHSIEAVLTVNFGN